MPNKQRNFCHNHYTLEHKCKAYNKTTKKFCGNVIQGRLHHHCSSHDEYNAECTDCKRIVIPAKLFCIEHKHFTNQAEQEINEKKTYHSQKTVNLTFLLCDTIQYIYMVHIYIYIYLWIQTKLKAEARHGVKRSYISSVEILDTIEEESRDNDSDNKGKVFVFFL